MTTAPLRPRRLLGRFLPKLGGPSGPPFFCPAAAKFSEARPSFLKKKKQKTFDYLYSAFPDTLSLD
jgi:hypothetical protein